MAERPMSSHNPQKFTRAIRRAVEYLINLYRDESTEIDSKTISYLLESQFYNNALYKKHFEIMLQRHIEGFENFIVETDSTPMHMHIRYRSMEFSAYIDNPSHPILRIEPSSEIDHATNGRILPVIFQQFQWNVILTYHKNTVRSAVRNITSALFVYFHKYVIPVIRRTVPAGPSPPFLRDPPSISAIDDPHSQPQTVTIENGGERYSIDLPPINTVPIPEEPDFSDEFPEQNQITFQNNLLTTKLHNILDRLLELHHIN